MPKAETQYGEVKPTTGLDFLLHERERESGHQRCSSCGQDESHCSGGQQLLQSVPIALVQTLSVLNRII